jgi:hypothetical protein
MEASDYGKRLSTESPGSMSDKVIVRHMAVNDLQMVRGDVAGQTNNILYSAQRMPVFGKGKAQIWSDAALHRHVSYLVGIRSLGVPGTCQMDIRAELSLRFNKVDNCFGWSRKLVIAEKVQDFHKKRQTTCD